MARFRKNPWRKHLSWQMWAIAAVAAGGIVWSLAALATDRAPVESYSLGLTALGVFVALVIYVRQGEEAAEKQQQLLEEIRDFLAPIIRQEEVAVGEPIADENLLDPYLEATELLENQGLNMGDGYRVLPRSKVALQPLGDLIHYWSAEDKQGKWQVSDLLGSARKTGKGNHPWLIIFRDPSDGQQRVWRISRGGKAKSDPTVVELTRKS